MVYLPLTPTTYPHTLTYYILINMDVSLKGSTLRAGVGNTSAPRHSRAPTGYGEALRDDGKHCHPDGVHTGYAGGHS